MGEVRGSEPSNDANGRYESFQQHHPFVGFPKVFASGRRAKEEAGS